MQLGVGAVRPAVFDEFIKILALALEAYGADRVFLSEQEFFVLFKAALDYRDLRGGGVMLVFHARGLRSFAVLELLKHRCRDIDLAEHLAKLLDGHSARSEQGGRLGGESDNGRFNAHGAVAAVDYGVYPAVKVGEHMLGAGGAWLARGVGARGGKRQPALLDYCPCTGV